MSHTPAMAATLAAFGMGKVVWRLRWVNRRRVDHGGPIAGVSREDVRKRLMVKSLVSLLAVAIDTPVDG